MNKNLRTQIEDLRFSIFGNKFDTIDNAREKFMTARMDAIIDAIDDQQVQLNELKKRNKK